MFGRPPGMCLSVLLLAAVFPPAADAAVTCGIGTYASGIVAGSGVFKIRGYHDDYLYKMEFLDGNDATVSTVGGSGGTPEVLSVGTANVEYITEVFVIMLSPAFCSLHTARKASLFECPNALL